MRLGRFVCSCAFRRKSSSSVRVRRWLPSDAWSGIVVVMLGKQAASGQEVCSLFEQSKREMRTCRNIEERMCTVREIQHPEHRLLQTAVVGSAHRPIEAPPTKLGLALRI